MGYTVNICLASASEIRRKLLESAGLQVEVVPATLDERAVQAALPDASPARLAQELAQAKAAQVAKRRPAALVLGADQVLEYNGRTYGKPASPEDAVHMLRTLRGRRHRLHAALCLHRGEQCLWRHLSSPEMEMLPLSDGFIDAYVACNWMQIRHCAGAYRVEAEGIMLFHRIGADYHAILGLPLLPLLAFLRQKGDLTT